MEYILHYVWQHRLYGRDVLHTSAGDKVEIIDPGIHNVQNAGPDFFNAKVKIDGVVWVGTVEIHERSSDWYRHHHDTDAAYNNVILHVVGTIDREVRTSDGKELPQVAVAVPANLNQRYEELLAEETYPPCYKVVPQISDLVKHSWMSRLTVERFEEKMARVQDYLQRTNGDWERTFFITLARNFGFGTNAQPFEQWAFTIDPLAVGKHRDDAFQVEAFFMGQAGLLDPALLPEEARDDYFQKLCAEYAFLKHKFGLQPIEPHVWRFGRLRPQNFPHVRLSQLANLFSAAKVGFSRILEANSVEALHQLLQVGVTDYWRTHYTFGEASKESAKLMRTDTLNLIIINTVAPMLFAYGRFIMDDTLSERAFDLLERIPAERNYIVRCWERAGLKVSHAADSQALIRLRKHYCDRKDCLRCRFGAEYLRQR